MEPIPASRCPRCGRLCAPPARFCPDDASQMALTEVAGYGEILSFTTLHSPPAGFAAPLHMALVQLEGGVKFFCHGAETRGLKVGARVAIEAVDQVYYFSTLSLGERALLFWRRGGVRAGERLSAFARSAAKRLTRLGR
ncbi:MAG: OB-fold domain-containing protein [Candidatus Rokubacteria bacterium]|nr:OB-fold domain-containing protein [Candidatus Rokubacteria bacterium]